MLQALDAGGKDGTIRHVMSGVNPQGCEVTSFKAPTAEELGHDFLWRIHKAVPIKGDIGIFNRSHYEDVLVVRVHNLVPKSVWSKRYDQINDFESMLAENGVKILKFFLHISKDEQKRRFEARLTDPDKILESEPRPISTSGSFGTTTSRAYEDVLRQMQRQACALVRDSGQQEMVPQPGRFSDHRRNAGRPEDEIPQAQFRSVRR